MAARAPDVSEAKPVAAQKVSLRHAAHPRSWEERDDRLVQTSTCSIHPMPGETADRGTHRRKQFGSFGQPELQAKPEEAIAAPQQPQNQSLSQVARDVFCAAAASYSSTHFCKPPPWSCRPSFLFRDLEGGLHVLMDLSRLRLRGSRSSIFWFSSRPRPRKTSTQRVVPSSLRRSLHVTSERPPNQILA